MKQVQVWFNMSLHIDVDDYKDEEDACKVAEDRVIEFFGDVEFPPDIYALEFFISNFSSEYVSE